MIELLAIAKSLTASVSFSRCKPVKVKTTAIPSTLLAQEVGLENSDYPNAGDKVSIQPKVDKAASDAGMPYKTISLHRVIPQP